MGSIPITSSMNQGVGELARSASDRPRVAGREGPAGAPLRGQVRRVKSRDGPSSPFPADRALEPHRSLQPRSAPAQFRPSPVLT